MDYIQAESDLTVRLTVRFVSDRRPANVPGSDNPYPGYDYRGQQRMTVGTGWVEYVQIFDDTNGGTCMCKDCRNSYEPETKFAIINITTANHLVFDDLEGAHTTCHLFFDNGGTPDTCEGVVTLRGMSTEYTELEGDRCYMKHFTHDLDLARRLDQILLHRDGLRTTISFELLKTSVIRQRHTSVEKKPLLFIISHPHGCRKHVSIGHWVSVDNNNSRYLSYNYTTATCPGSSGAHVFVPYELLQMTLGVRGYDHTGNHCGTSDRLRGINYCQIERGEPSCPHV